MLSGNPGRWAKTSEVPAFEVWSHNLRILQEVVSAIRRKEPSLLSATPFGKESPSRRTVVCLLCGSYFIILPVLSPLIMADINSLQNCSLIIILADTNDVVMLVKYNFHVKLFLAFTLILG